MMLIFEIWLAFGLQGGIGNEVSQRARRAPEKPHDAEVTLRERASGIQGPTRDAEWSLHLGGGG